MVCVMRVEWFIETDSPGTLHIQKLSLLKVKEADKLKRIGGLWFGFDCIVSAPVIQRGRLKLFRRPLLEYRKTVLQHWFYSIDNIVHGKAEFFEQQFGRGRFAEAVDADDCAVQPDVFVPAVGVSGFYGDARQAFG